MWKQEEEAGTHNPFVPEKMREWPSFTVVRNPYTRMASLWWTARHMPKFQGSEFTHYLKATNRPQIRYSHAKTILKFEDLPKAFSALPFWPGGEFQNMNSSKRRRVTRRGIKWKPRPSCSKILTDEAMSLIRKKYAVDFETFGYDPDEPFCDHLDVNPQA
jgi:hypothetical protein